MLTLCAVESNNDAKVIENITRRIHPDGSFVCAKNRSEIINYIMDYQPDIVWLDALEENFTIASIKRKNTPHINFIFVSEDTQLAYDALRVRASGYILKPITEEAVSEELNNLRFIDSNSKNRMTVQCFGKFEVYLNGKIMNFSRSLSKEALAYLIDNKGAACTVQEICDVLWENRPVSTSLKSQCRVIMSSLKKDLEAQGAEGVLVKGWNYWGIDADKISCDYYDYLRNRGKGKNSFQGEYMSQYSWAEMTSGRLYQMDRENKK